MGTEVRGSVSTTWWFSLTMHSLSMPYCHRYPDICHCDWGPRVQLGTKWIRYWRVYTVSDHRCVYSKFICQLYAVVQKSWRKIKRGGNKEWFRGEK